MQAHQERDRGHEVVGPRAHLAHHVAQRGAYSPNDTDGNEYPRREKRGQPEGMARRGSPLFANEAHDQRQARQVAGLSTMLRMPHIGGAAKAAPPAPSTARVSPRNNASTYFTPISASLATICSRGQKPTWRSTSLPCASKRT